MYHNAVWCFCYEVYVLYIIDYAVEYDQLFSILKPGVTHTILSGLPCLNHNPAPFLMLDKHNKTKSDKKKPPYLVAKMCCHATCLMLCGFFRISSYLIGNTADSDLYLQCHRLPHKEHNNLLSTAAEVFGRSHRGVTDNVSVNI